LTIQRFGAPEATSTENDRMSTGRFWFQREFWIGKRKGIDLQTHGVSLSVGHDAQCVSSVVLELTRGSSR
jgi:hypothetical protein